MCVCFLFFLLLFTPSNQMIRNLERYCPTSVSCHYEESFSSPHLNTSTNSHYDAILRPKVTLGLLHQIHSISDKEQQQLVSQGKTADTTQNHQEVFPVDKTGESTDGHIQKIPTKVDLQGLNEKKKEQAFKLLGKEAVFCSID